MNDPRRSARFWLQWTPEDALRFAELIVNKAGEAQQHPGSEILLYFKRTDDPDDAVGETHVAVILPGTRVALIKESGS
jgi:hypothetical protein